MCFYTLFNFFFCLLKMQNEYLNEFTPAEAIKQVSQYFSIIDNSVQVGDTNRKYTPSKNAASPGGPQADNSYITFNISPVGENLCDLYNSTIQAELNLSLKVSSAVTASDSITGGNVPAVWIGYPDSMDAVSTYQILANGRSIYTQDNAHNEAFITGCGATEAVKKVDIFSKARHADVWKRADTAKSGYIINLGADKSAGATISDIKIPIKIDLRRFLVLDAIRYMPAFAGNIQLKIKFSTEALQIAPLSIEDIIQNPFLLTKLASYPKITNKFVPFEEEFTMIKRVQKTESSGAITAITLTAGTQQFTKASATFNNCFSYLNCFSLDPNVYQDLINRYSQTALSFPIKRMDWTTMNGDAPTASTQATYTATFTPTYVNAIYVLFKRKPNYYTNYENPLFESYQLNMGAYGNVPADPENTYGPIFYETCANAMNTNNDLCGFNVDVMRSLTATALESTGYKSNDTTHFFMGFPTETDFTFQQGQTSNSPITYKLSVKGSTATTGFNEKPEIGFLRHVCFSIMVKPNGPPVVVIDDYDLSQPDA